MRKLLSLILAFVLCLGVFAGCKTESPDATSTATPAEKDESASIAVSPLPETLDVNNLDNCTVSVSFENGDVYLDDSGKLVMKASVYSYEVYDMADISSLKSDDTIVRLGEEIKITDIERLESGLVRINGGEENGGFDLVTNDDTVYYESGMNDIKAYYELGEVVLPLAEDFVYTDESDINSEAKEYFAGDFLSSDVEIEYNFNPHNTSIVIENGKIIEMKRVYMP